MTVKRITDLISGDITPDGIVDGIRVDGGSVWVTFRCGCVLHGKFSQTIDVAANLSDLL